MSSKPTYILRSILVVIVLSLLAGCRANPQTSPDPASPSPGKSAAAPTPTLTPEPLALRVNGEGVSLAEYQAELRQLQDAQQAMGQTAAADQQRQRVLDDLTDTLLLAQGAAENGFQLDDVALQARIDSLAQQRGGAQGLQDWMAKQGYTEAAFRAALKRQVAAAWQRDKIAAGVPTTAEQIHARQILTIDEENANQVLQLVKIPGTSFSAYAYRYDPLTGGDLGWFPRGYLTQPEVETAAFALQPGEISPVIKSAVGYHIIQVIAREPNRPISPDALRVLQHKALADWLKNRRDASKIEILLPS